MGLHAASRHGSPGATSLPKEEGLDYILFRSAVYGSLAQGHAVKIEQLPRL